MHLETVPSHIVEPESQKWFHSTLYNPCIIIYNLIIRSLGDNLLVLFTAGNNKGCKMDGLSNKQD